MHQWLDGGDNRVGRVEELSGKTVMDVYGVVFGVEGHRLGHVDASTTLHIGYMNAQGLLRDGAKCILR